MISGLLTLLLLATTTPAEATAGEVDALIAGLAPDGSRAELHFRERRESSLLDEPLIVSGTLRREEGGDLVRQTVEPRRETQTLTGSMIIIERPGRAPRNYSMGHAPELGVIYHAMTALLAGDAVALRERFEVDLVRDDTGWRIGLRPRADELAERVDTLSLSGSADRIERFEMTLADGETIATELSRKP